MPSLSSTPKSHKSTKPERAALPKPVKPPKVEAAEAVAPLKVAQAETSLTIGETPPTPVEVVPVVAELVLRTIELAPPNLADLEQVIASGLRTFVDVGQALSRIRDAELYKATHATFEAYCAARWDMRRAYAYRLIGAASVVENVANWRQQKLTPPTVESHARELAKLPAKEQPKAWAAAVRTAPDGVVTAKHVASIVTARLPEPATKPKPTARITAPPVTLPVSVDAETALAEALESHMLGWTLGHERFVATLKAASQKAREHFSLRDVANG